MKKVKKTHKTITNVVVPILNNEYKAIVCWGDSKTVRKIMCGWGYEHTLKYIEDERKDRRGATFYGVRLHPVIVLPKYPKTADQIGTLAHEALHAVYNVFDLIEETNRAEEIVAHSIGAIVRTVLQASK